MHAHGGSTHRRLMWTARRVLRSSARARRYVPYDDVGCCDHRAAGAIRVWQGRSQDGAQAPCARPYVRRTRHSGAATPPVSSKQDTARWTVARGRLCWRHPVLNAETARSSTAAPEQLSRGHAWRRRDPADHDSRTYPGRQGDEPSAHAILGSCLAPLLAPATRTCARARAPVVRTPYVPSDAIERCPRGADGTSRNGRFFLRSRSCVFTQMPRSGRAAIGGGSCAVRTAV